MSSIEDAAAGLVGSVVVARMEGTIARDDVVATERRPHRRSRQRNLPISFVQWKRESESHVHSKRDTQPPNQGRIRRLTPPQLPHRTAATLPTGPSVRQTDVQVRHSTLTQITNYPNTNANHNYRNANHPNITPIHAGTK